MVQCIQLLRSYANHEEFAEQWLSMLYGDMAFTLLLWLASVAERIRGTKAWTAFSDGEADDIAHFLPVLGFAISSLIIFSTAFCMLYFCRAMICAVDTFCTATTNAG